MRRMRRSWLPAIGLGVLVTIGSARDARACPSCKEAVADGSDEESDVARGYNWSVLFMIAVPFSMMGTGALAIRRAVKRGTLPEF